MHALPQINGREAMLTRYLPAYMALDPDNSIKVVLYTNELATLVGAEKSGKAWDDVVLVKYQSIEHFKTFITSKEYLETAMPHMLASVEERIFTVLEQQEF